MTTCTCCSKRVWAHFWFATLLISWWLLGPVQAQPSRFGSDPLPEAAATSRTHGPGDEHWQDGFDNPQFSGMVRALALARNGDLLVGGDFAEIGSVRDTRNVARWNGWRWQPIGAGLIDSVAALLELLNGDLIAATHNSHASGPSGLHRWNGSQWQLLTTVNGTVSKLAELPNGDLLVAGNFLDAGGNLWADYLARWDGAMWQSVGGTALNAPVSDVEVLASGQFIVAGEFTAAGGVPTADYIARWNGSAWQALGAGLPTKVSQLAVAANGDVIAARDNMPVSGAVLQRFNGTSWQQMHDPIAGLVTDIVEKPSGDLLLGGVFGVGVRSQGVIYWDGTSWQSVGQQRLLSAPVALRRVQLLLRPTGEIIAGGAIMGSPGSWRSLVRYDGVAWRPFGKGLTAPFGIFTVATGPGGEPYVAQASGEFGANQPIVHWNGRTWENVSISIPPTWGISVLATAPNGDLLAVANSEPFAAADSTRIFRQAGATWQGVGGPLLGTGFSLSVAPAGDILVGGYNYAANTGIVYHWNGASWQSLGVPLNNVVNVVRHSPTGELVVGGAFTDADGNANADRVARWDGTTWQPLGPGLDSVVYDMAWTPSGDLIAAGRFKNAGGNPAADYVARWDGAAWQPLGPGLNKQAWAVTVAVNGDVIVGGLFVDAGGNPAADRIARWDGTAWQPLGTGLNGPPRALAMGPADAIYVVGDFIKVGDGSKPTSRFAIYNTHLIGLPEETVTGTRLQLYPNPARTTVRLAGAAAPTATLLDGLGRSVRTVALAEGAATIDLAGLVPGLYVVRAGAMVQRLVVE